MLPLCTRLSRHATDFIDDARLRALVESRRLCDVHAVRDVIAKALEKVPLAVDEAALLLHAGTPELRAEIFAAARALKERVYGNRIVLFAPLYVGNRCVNYCTYCGFRRDNRRRCAAPCRRGSSGSRWCPGAAGPQASHRRLRRAPGTTPSSSPPASAPSTTCARATGRSGG
jgi:hypothetical protein